MIIDFILIALVTYVFLFLERISTVSVGYEGNAFCGIDLCKQKKLRAPFKYRPLVFWIAILLGITSKYIKPLIAHAEKYYFNVYLIESKGLEKYYIYKYFLFLIMNIVFYWYINLLGLSGFIGVFILDFLVALTFIADCLDYLTEIIFYSLFLVGILSNYSFVFFFFVAVLASLNRESSIFLIPISFVYCNTVIFVVTTIGFLMGFVLPRWIYREPSDKIDSRYYSGFRFLTFNPIKNWTHSIWPPLKERFTGLESRCYIEYENKRYEFKRQLVPVITKTKEFFLNRIFLGITFIIFSFVLFIASYNTVGEFLRPLIWIFSVFILLISLPADIREIRVYCPTFILLVPCLMRL